MGLALTTWENLFIWETILSSLTVESKVEAPRGLSSTYKCEVLEWLNHSIMTLRTTLGQTKAGAKTLTWLLKVANIRPHNIAEVIVLSSIWAISLKRKRHKEHHPRIHPKLISSLNHFSKRSRSKMSSSTIRRKLKQIQPTEIKAILIYTEWN